MDKEKKFREKISQMMKEKEEAVNAVHEKYRQMKLVSFLFICSFS